MRKKDGVKDKNAVVTVKNAVVMKKKSEDMKKCRYERKCSCDS